MSHIHNTIMSVPKLGLLFEFYMYFSSGYSANRQWNSMVNMIDDDQGLTDDQQDKLYEDNVNHFIGWLLWHICSIGSHGRRQMFFITFIAHYYGLSRDGIDVLAKYGYGVTMDLFDTMRMTSSMKCDVITRYIYLHSFVVVV